MSLSLIHIYLAAVGRYKLNKRLNMQSIVPLQHRTITQQDIVNLVRHMILINNGHEGADDIDHLGNRRVKTVGELIQAKLRVGLRRMERVVRERMSIRESDNVTPIALINIRPVVAAIREFFGSSQLSQFMEPVSYTHLELAGSDSWPAAGIPVAPGGALIRASNAWK